MIFPDKSCSSSKYVVTNTQTENYREIQRNPENYNPHEPVGRFFHPDVELVEVILTNRNPDNYTILPLTWW